MIEQLLMSGKLGMLEFLKDIQEFVIKCDINDMFYKAGLPSTTIS